MYKVRVIHFVRGSNAIDHVEDFEIAAKSKNHARKEVRLLRPGCAIGQAWRIG